MFEKTGISVKCVVAHKLQEMFDTEPSYASKEALAKWKTLGPYNIYKVLRRGDVSLYHEALPVKSLDEQGCIMFTQSGENLDANLPMFGRVFGVVGSIIEGQLSIVDHRAEGYARIIDASGGVSQGFFKRGKFICDGKQMQQKEPTEDDLNHFLNEKPNYSCS